MPDEWQTMALAEPPKFRFNPRDPLAHLAADLATERITTADRPAAAAGPAPPDHARNTPTKRNLIFHVYADRESDIWRRHLVKLGHQSKQFFNRRKLFAIATGPATESPATVTRFIDRIIPPPYETYHTQNCPQLREVASLRLLLELIADPSPDQATFYAHTKGNTTADGTSGATRWAAAMYRHLLTPQALKKLADFAAVGTHKITWPAGMSPYPSGLTRGNWMSAGTFFWFRHDAIFTNPAWRDIAHDRYGAEAWLSTLLPADSCFTAWQPWQSTAWPTPNPYDPDLYPDEAAGL